MEKCCDQLLKIKEYIDTNNLEGLENYFSDTIIPLGHNMLNSNKNIEKLSFIQNFEIRSIISAKLTYGMEKGIETKVEISEPILIYGIDIVDLARVLEVLFDNAMESIFQAEERWVNLCVSHNYSELWITISNSMDQLKFLEDN